MALVVETGSGVDGANTFINRAGTITAAAAVGVTLADDATTDALILNAAMFLTGIGDWRGEQINGFASLPWPRENVYIGSSLWDQTMIPADIVNAQVQLVLVQKAGTPLFSTTDGQVVTEETVGPITTRYSDKYGAVTAPGIGDIPLVSTMLAKWRNGSFGFRTVRA